MVYKVISKERERYVYFSLFFLPCVLVVPPQVFYATTKLVLQTKKESAKESGGRSDTFKVGKSSGGSGKKTKCC